MTDTRSARYRDGSAYAGHKQYLGGGTQRSCGKCGQHKAVAGFRLLRPYGMVCAECQGGKK